MQYFSIIKYSVLSSYINNPIEGSLIYWVYGPRPRE